MPGRSDFPSEYFDSNPFDGETVEDMYRRLQWGNEPTEIVEIEAPEPLVSLGCAAKLILQDRAIEWDEEESHLAVGRNSNKLYIFPKGAREIPQDGYAPIGESVQIDYYSEKGSEDGYYFHEHETPYPQVYAAPGGFFVLEPEVEGETRSYAVSDEGIIG
jgi:hypothetical protein